MLGYLALIGCNHQPASQDSQTPTELSPTEALQIMKDFATTEVSVPTIDGEEQIPPVTNVRAMIVRNTILGVESMPGGTIVMEIG